MSLFAAGAGGIDVPAASSSRSARHVAGDRISRPAQRQTSTAYVPDQRLVHGLVRKRLRGGEPGASAAAKVEDEAAAMRSLGDAVCQVEEKLLTQLRQRLLHRTPLDDVDRKCLEALRVDPTNLSAIKAHAAALVDASSLDVDAPGEPNMNLRAPRAACRGCAWAAQSPDATDLVPPPHDPRCCLAKGAANWDEDHESDTQYGNSYRPMIVADTGAMGYASEALTRRTLAVDLYRYALLLTPSDADSWVSLANLHLAGARDTSSLPSATVTAVAAAGADDAGQEDGEPGCPLAGREAAGKAPTQTLDEDGSKRGEGGSGAEGRGHAMAVAKAMIDTALLLQPSHCGGLLVRGNMQRDVEGDPQASSRSLFCLDPNP